MFIFTASQSGAQVHYKSTIDNQVDNAILREHLNHEQLDEIAGRASGSIYAWGVTPGPRNVKLWSQMRPGDLAVAYREHSFRSLLRVTGTTHNEALAERLWGFGTTRDGKRITWEYIYFLDKMAKFNVYSPRVYQGHTGPLDNKTADEILLKIEKTTGLRIPALAPSKVSV